MNKLTLSALLMVLTLGLAACSSEDNEGVDVEQAADNAGEMMEDAADGLPGSDLLDVSDHPVPEAWPAALRYAGRALRTLPPSLPTPGLRPLPSAPCSTWNQVGTSCRAFVSTMSPAMTTTDACSKSPSG